MGGTYYFVLRQGSGRIFVTTLHFTSEKAPMFTLSQLQWDIAHQWRSQTGAHWGTYPSNYRRCPTSAGKHAKYWRVVDRESGTKRLEIESTELPCAFRHERKRGLTHAFQLLGTYITSFIVKLKTNLTSRCISKLSHKVNWVGAFWNKP